MFFHLCICLSLRPRCSLSLCIVCLRKKETEDFPKQWNNEFSHCDTCWCCCAAGSKATIEAEKSFSFCVQLWNLAGDMLCMLSVVKERGKDAKVEFLSFHVFQNFHSSEKEKTPTMSMKTQFSFLPCHPRCFGTETDEQNIPMKTTTAIAGRNLSISCPGVNEHSLIDTLTWKTSTHKIIAKYINNNEQKPMVQNERVSCLLFFLIFLQNQHNFADWLTSFCRYLQVNLLPDNYSLHFTKVQSSDSGEYSCIINDRHSPESIVDLLIQGALYSLLYMLLCVPISSVIEDTRKNILSMNSPNDGHVVQTVYI